MIKAAREMHAVVASVNDGSDERITKFQMRAGVHTGAVVAGVVGSQKWQYDIWGDSVNIASRMESSSEVGRINISEATYALVKKDFVCEYRGEIAVKNRGVLKMYFVKED